MFGKKRNTLPVVTIIENPCIKIPGNLNLSIRIYLKVVNAKLGKKGFHLWKKYIFQISRESRVEKMRDYYFDSSQGFKKCPYI